MSARLPPLPFQRLFVNPPLFLNLPAFSCARYRISRCRGSDSQEVDGAIKFVQDQSSKPLARAAFLDAMNHQSANNEVVTVYSVCRISSELIQTMRKEEFAPP